MREAAIKSAVEAVESIQEILGPVTALVIGSYARGDFNQWSDIDLLIMSPDFNPNPLERLEQLAHMLKKYPSLEIVPLTPSEFQRQIKMKTPMAEEALQTGLIIKDGLNVFTGSIARSNLRTE